MVTMAQERPGVPGPAAPSSRMSMLRMGLPGRLAIAAGAIVVLWSAIAFGLS